MVLIFSGHHFGAQNVFRIEKPLAACVATEEQMLLVATEGHRIEAHSLNQDGDRQNSNSWDQAAIHSFPTVDLVKMIIYSPIGRYVAAVEVKASRHNLLSAVRVYLNWQSSDAKDKPMRARIAGRVTPSSHSTVGQLDMIEIPLARQAYHIAICPSTGNLATTCFSALVCVFVFRIKVHDISRLRFYDFDPLVNVQLAFPVKEVSLCEDVLACMSHNELQVLGLGPMSSKARLKSTMKDYGKSREETTLKPQHDFVDDPHFVMWDLSRCRAEMQNNGRNVGGMQDIGRNLGADSWPLNVYMPSLVRQMENSDEFCREGRQILGPVEYVLGRPVSVELVENTDGDIQASTLLYRRFPTEVISEPDSTQCVHSMQLKPFYSNKGNTDVETQKENNDAMRRFVSGRRNTLLGMVCIFSTSHECCLYEIELGASGPSVTQLRSLMFSTAARQVIADGAVLHAVSSSVLETYTLGMSQFTSINIPELTAACNNDSTCLVGLCPFLNLKHAVFGGGHVVLFSSSIDAENSSPSPDTAAWTAYDLLCPSAADFHRDMVEEAKSFQESNPEVYAQILREALCVLCLASDSSLQQHIEEICSCLGEFYLRSDVYTDNVLGLEFLKRADLHLENIVRKILDRCTNTESSQRLLALLMSIFLDDFVHFSGAGITLDLANDVMDFVNATDPSQLVRLLLGSRFTEYDSDQALNIMKSRINLKLGSPEDYFAACFLCVNNGASDKVPSLLLSISTKEMIDMARKYPHVWFEKKNVASPILQILQQLKPEAFVCVLIELIECKHLEICFLVDLCQSDWEDLGLAPNKHILLECCLESYITRAMARQCLDGIISYPEIVMGLIDIYLNKLSCSSDICKVPSALHRVAKPACLFGPRKSWLNELPPFSGRDFQGESCYDGESLECSCVKCCDYLLRIQSLLCSIVATPEIKLRVNRASKLDAKVTLKGALSLLILTSNPTEAIEVLVRNGEHVALKEYGKDALDGPKMWKPMLSALYHRWARMENGGTVLSAMHSVLSYLSEMVSVTELLEFFPDGEDLGPFVCHIKRCFAKQQAESLKLEIMTKERDLQSFV